MVVTEILASEIHVECPHCHERQEGFFGDPRGGDFECEECGESYTIDKEADVELRC